MNAEQVKSINELCEIYHRLDCDRKTDTAVITLLLSLLRYAPLGDMPQGTSIFDRFFRAWRLQPLEPHVTPAVAALARPWFAVMRL